MITKPDLIIESVQNDRIKSVVRLRESKERRETKRFLIEGVRELSRAMESGFSIIEIYFLPGLLKDEGQELLRKGKSAKAKIIEVNQRVYDKIAMREGTEGFVAVAAEKVERDVSSTSKKITPLVLVCDGLEKPGNLGAILRSADGAGITEVAITGNRCDLFNPQVIRASQGAVFSLRATAWSNEDLKQELVKRNCAIYSADPAATKSYDQVDMKSATAIVIGTEAAGLSDFWKDAATEHIKIPMLGINDSLNASVSAAILMYEAQRQRRN